MKTSWRKFAGASTAVAAMAMAIGAPAAASNSLSFQGVTFETLALGDGTLQFSILGATGATGNWTGIRYLEAFQFKNLGDLTGATILQPSDSAFSVMPVSFGSPELNAHGCSGGNSGGACFSAGASPLDLTDTMQWVIRFSGAGLHFDLPHLKVNFWTQDTDTKATGSLLSMDIPASPIPEPRSHAMLLAGLGMLGFWARRAKRGAA